MNQHWPPANLTIVLLLTSLCTALVLNLQLFFGQFHWSLILLWLISVGSLWVSSYCPKSYHQSNFTNNISHKNNQSFFKRKKWRQLLNQLRSQLLTKANLINAGFILLPVALRVWQMFQPRYHLDEYISAHISANYQLLTDNFFGPFPQDKAQWVCQFPSPYFFLQKIFFLVFGANLLTVKLSVIPYLVLISWLLFLCLKIVFDQQTARISLIFYSFLAIAWYLESWGLHFMASTGCYLICFYLMARQIKKPSLAQQPKYAIWLGLGSAGCYFFYASSYLALPMAIAFYLLLSVIKRKILLKPLLIMLLSFALTVSPFVTQMVKNQDYYLLGRFNQVKLVKGSWSGEKRPFFQAFSTIKTNFSQASQALLKDNVGGGGGYSFAHLALFDPFTLSLLMLGWLSLSWVLKNKWLALFIQAHLLLLFLTAMVLTIPPPAYHRFSLAFPFIVISLASLIYSLKQVIKQQTLRLIVLTSLTLVFCWQNYHRFQQAIAPELANQKLVKLAKLVKHLAGPNSGKKIYVAAFPGYAFEKFYYFAASGQPGKIKTDYHKTFLNQFPSQENYLFILAMPKTFLPQFQAQDPQAKVIRHSNDHFLFYN